MATSTQVGAKVNKNDEFYTRLEDIESEISSHSDYVKQFQGKVVLCNCDNPKWSNFFLFFKLHFKQLGLKKLISTHFNKDGSPSYKLEWSGEMLNEATVNMVKTNLEGDGDFRSDECKEILKEADIVVTNPPFSLFREYIALLMEYDKKFIILGNNNAVSYKDFFSVIKDGKVWAGYSFNKTMVFEVGEGYKYDKQITDKINDGKKYGKVPAISWFTNLDIDKRHELIPLTKNYKGNESKYPSYANYDGLDCNKVSDIPKDYFGVIGVPITFLGKHNPDQFEILGLSMTKEVMPVPVQMGKEFCAIYFAQGNKGHVSPKEYGLCLYDKNGKAKVPYARILIRRKPVEVTE